MSEDALEVRLDAAAIVRRTLFALVLLELLLCYLDVVVCYYEAIEHSAVQDLCNLVIEGSLGGWFASAQTLVVGLVLVLIAVRVGADPRAGRRRAGWTLLAVFFLYMAVDDGTGFHEAIGTWFEDTRDAQASMLHAFPSYWWQVLFVPPLAALGLFTLYWSWRETSRRGRTLVLCGLACFALAVGLDFVEGIETPYELATERLGLHEDTIPHFSGVVEELTEDFGTTLLLCAFLDHLLGISRDVRLRIQSRV